MLPYANNPPAARLKLSGLLTIPRPIVADLLLPPKCVGLGCRKVLWASVPEAPINEDAHSFTGKNDVRSDPKRIHGSLVLAEAQACAKEAASQSNLDCRVIPRH